MIEQRFIKAATRADFESKLNSGQVSPNSIAFILGSKEIWTQGQYFPCNYTQSEIDQMLSSKYVKPLTGIPATDLSSDVQISLSKADNAVQIIVEDANGHDYIEVGGLKWATTNVGANSETALGYKIAWGETQGYASGTHTFNWANYKFTIPNTNPIQFSRYNSYNQGDSIILQPIDDIVRVTMGGTWRIPTRDEMIAFADKCNYEWIANYKNSGVAGLLFTDKEDSSKSIFFPANAPNNGCYYWTSTLRSTINQAMRWECWNNKNPNFNIYTERYNGLTVRGILATETFEGITEQQKKFYNNKQDVIPDLDTIRSGAALGATAVQTETDPTVPAWAKESTKPTYTASEVGLGNVTNDAQVKRTEMGVADGVATLDSGGKVPSSQLPSYVDDVLEYDSKSVFPATGEGGKIYIDTSNNTSWRWTGSTYVQTKGDLVIGTTTGSAADGGVVNSHINNTTVHITANERSTWNAKQDAISDLATIRTNASTGAGLKSKVDGIEAGAQVNVIETVKVNNTALTPSSKAVNITVPTKLSNLSTDSTHRTVTDAEKSNWNNKLDNIIIDANGYEYVDLGLPSGKLWATMNIGATYETDYGLYFQWGDTQGYTASQIGSNSDKKYFSWADYKYSNNGGSTESDITKYNNIDGKLVLETSDDAANVNMGGGWRMPNDADFTELLNYCRFVVGTRKSGVDGMLVTSRNNGNTLFFPFSGAALDGGVNGVGNYCNFWLNFKRNTNSITAMRVYGFNGYSLPTENTINRCYGLPIRAVLDSTPAKAVTDSQIAKWDSAVKTYDIASIYIDETTSTGSSKVTITGDLGKDNPDGVIAKIRKNSKAYACKYDSTYKVLKCYNVIGDYGLLDPVASHFSFMKLPQFWFKCTQPDESVRRFKIDFTMDQNAIDGTWNEWDGDTFIGIYEAVLSDGPTTWNNSNRSSKDTSSITLLTGIDSTDKAGAFFSQRQGKQMARNNGDGFTLITYEAHQIMQLLFYAWYGNVDAQLICGAGSNVSSWPIDTGAQGRALDLFGNVTGNYDGTMSITSFPDTKASSNPTNTWFWGLQNWWGNLNEWIDNLIIVNNAGPEVEWLDDGSTEYSRSIAILDKDGSIKRVIRNIYGDDMVLNMLWGKYADVIPTKFSYNYNDYSDGGYTVGGYVNGGAGRVALRSGDSGFSYGGVGYLYVDYSPDGASASYGSRIQYSGPWVEVGSVGDL